MKKCLSLSLLILALLVAAIVPASAQSSVDPTALSFVQSAFTNTFAVSSLSVDTQSSTATAGLGSGGGNGNGGGFGGFGGFGVNRTSSYQLASNASDDSNVSGTTTTLANASNATPDANVTPVDNNTTEEIRIVDGKTYIRYTEIPERMQQQNPPADWVDVATLPQPAQGTFGGGFATSAPTANQILAALSLPVDATGVTAISEQAADSIDGDAMRVFQITLDVDALLKSDSAALLGGFGRGGFGGGRTGFGANRPGGANGAQATPPVNAPAGAPAVTIEAPSAANTQVTLTVWIGADNLVHRITSVVARSGMGQDGQGSTTLTTTTDFANFNQPMTITAPTAGS